MNEESAHIFILCNFSFRFDPLIWRKLHFFIPGDVWFYSLMDYIGHHLGTTDSLLSNTSDARSSLRFQFTNDIGVLLKDFLKYLSAVSERGHIWMISFC